MVELLLASVLALALGLVLGWAFAARRASASAVELAAAQTRAADADVIRRARDEVERERNEAQRDASALRARLEARDAEVAGLKEQGERLGVSFNVLSRDHADLKARSEERERARAEAVQQLRDAREQLQQQFDSAAAKALETAQRQFLERADARFRQSEEASGQKIAALLQPVNERLQRYEQTVTRVEQERRDAFGSLHGQIEAMRVGQESVRTEAAKLVNALRNAPKARGRWGEQQLRNVLESCGLSEHSDFQTEVSVDDGEGGRFRPDVIIRIPGGKTLIVDAKVSLNAYQDAFGAVEEAERTAGLAAHAAAMRAHVSGLGSKSYWAQFADAPDYVIMFVPGEHFLSAALEHDGELWNYAFDRKVLLATPTNLVAIARTVSAVWQQEKLARDARAIGELGKELYGRLSVMGGHVAKLGRNLELAAGAYNSMVGSLESQVLTQARRFEQLNIDTGARQIDNMPVVETAIRPLTKLAAPVDVAAE